MVDGPITPSLRLRLERALAQAMVHTDHIGREGRADVAKVSAGQLETDLLTARKALLTTCVNNSERRLAAKVMTDVVVHQLRLRWLCAVRGESTDAAGLLRRYERWRAGSDDDEREPPWPSDPVLRLALQCSCPAALTRMIVASLGFADAGSYLHSANQVAPIWLRINHPHASKVVVAALTADGVVVDASDPAGKWLRIAAGPKLRASKPWREGWCEVQDIGSQRIVDLCAVSPGQIVVDLCAGHGGKTLALQSAMHDRGELWFDDIDDSALQQNIGRQHKAGYRNGHRGLPPAGSADVVLVDAPCSSTGTLRRSPTLRYAPVLDGLPEWTQLQRSLALTGLSLLKPGGRLVTATCSVLDVEAAATTGVLPGAKRDVHAQWLPHREHTDGFQVATYTTHNR